MGYGLWVFPANQLGKSKNLWPIREYGLYWVYVRRESTVVQLERIHQQFRVPYYYQYYVTENENVRSWW
jgi:hypothetical protein